MTSTFAAAVVLLTACGAGSDTEIDAVGSDDEAPVAGEQGAASDVNGLRVTLTGVVSGDTLCPGNTRPCATLDGDVTIDGATPPADEPARVSGVLSNGVLRVDGVEPVTDILDWLADHCVDEPKRTESEFLAAESLSIEEVMEALGTDDEEVVGPIGTDPLGLYIHSIPDAYAIRWISPRQIVHLGVVGDPEPHRQALVEMGVDEYVCVVGDFKRTDAELARIQEDVVAALQDRPDLGSWGAGRSPELGAVTVDLPQADEALIAAIDDQFGDGVILNASILVHNGTIADYEAAMEATDDAVASGDGSPSPDTVGLVARCGSIRFPTIPPDPEAFPPIGGEVLAIFEDLSDHPVMVEMQSFLDGHDWFVAEQSADHLVLFGRATAGGGDVDPPYASMGLEKRDGVWLPAGGFGQCHIEMEAPGFGPAETILDPDHEPDPASTELHLWINERNCASGQAPVDREVLPIVIETETSVEIVTLVEPVSGGADCQGNPWHAITVTLDQPLGDRTVYDGRQSPRVERTWPPDVEGLDG